MIQLGSHNVEMEAVPSLRARSPCSQLLPSQFTACPDSLQLREAAAQLCPQAGICSHHLEGSKIKGSCLILLQSSLSISIRVSSVRAHSTHPWKNILIQALLLTVELREVRAGSDRRGWGGRQVVGRMLTHPLPVQRGVPIPTPGWFCFHP